MRQKYFRKKRLQGLLKAESKAGRSEEQPRDLGKWGTQGKGGGGALEDEVRGWWGGGRETDHM